MKYEELKEMTIRTINNRKFQTLLIIILFAIIIISSSVIRTSNLSLLKDSTTGKYIPLALDPFYFMRMAETIVETGGNMPAVDIMRSPSINVAWHPEILPQVIVKIYNVARVFDPSITIQYISVISPVIFYIVGIILFYFLCLSLSGKKIVALLSTALLAYAPAYLYRTMAGFSDHEAIGMISIFAFFLVYLLGLKYFEKSWKNTIFYSIAGGFMAALVLATWGGAITFVLTTMPFAFFLYWFFVKKDSLKAIVFYLLLILSATLFPLIFGYSWLDMIGRSMSSYGLLVPFVTVFILIDFTFSKIKYGLKNIIFEKYIALYSFVVTLLIGLLGLTILGKSISGIIADIWIKLINPFGGSDRLGSTVAENSQPYLIQWIAQSGQIIFYLFFLGVIIVGINFAMNIKKPKLKYLFIGSWVLVVSGILFSRISPDYLFNGSTFLSQSFYLLSLIIFGIVLMMVAMDDEIKVRASEILLLSILFFTLINGRSAARVFFLIAPFVAFSASYGISKIYSYAKKSKEEISKIVLWGLFVIAIIGLTFSAIGNYNNVSTQARYAGPSANTQWQEAMEWTRNNTESNGIFIHWWDYGYWVQSLGERPTVTDGGHSGGIQADHYIGRYVLTTPNPDSAFSYMKTWNVSYLLIDQTDLGKYSAYSSIGGGAIDSNDRLASIPIMPANDRQMQETANGTIMVFSGGSYLHEDIIYEQKGEQIFLPSNKAAIIGIIVKTVRVNTGIKIEQPVATYIYKNVQSMIPLRYAYYNNQLIDYGSGLDVVAFIIPSFNGQTTNSMGATVYLSSKVFKSLFSQLFLLDDAFENYPTMKLIHTESDPLIKQLRNYGYEGGEFIFYNGFRGPIKIWGVNYPEGTQIIKEFKDLLNNGYAQFDEVFY